VRAVELALARNRMPARAGYFSRWVHVRIEASPCVFTGTLEPGAVLPLPMAHGEGRFCSLAPGRAGALAAAGQAPLRYSTGRWAAGGGLPGQPEWIGGSDCGDVQCARPMCWQSCPIPSGPRTSVR